VTYFLNFETPFISRKRLKLETSNLAHRLVSGGPRTKWKIRSKGVVNGSRDLRVEFWDPLHISETVEARNIKFGMQLSHWGVLTKKCKIRSKGDVKGSRDLFLEFRDPSISRERLNLETSNLARRLDTGDTNEKNTKLGQHGRKQGYVTCFFKFWNTS